MTPETQHAINKEFIKPGIFPKTFSRGIQKLFNERQTGDYDFETLLICNARAD